LMTAGHGVAHSEEGTGYRGEMHGVQLWVAQPDHTRHGPPAFEHHDELPQVDLGDGIATVLIGELAGVASPARRDTEHVGIDVDLRAGRAEIPLRLDDEHALVVLSGAVNVDSTLVEPGHLAYLGVGRDHLDLTAEHPTRALLVGGVPFDESVLMWWNFVARTRDDITEAHRDWTTAAARFGHVDSRLPRHEIGPPPWRPQ
jgi:quercetin 2,3-dioxygenase